MLAAVIFQKKASEQHTLCERVGFCRGTKLTCVLFRTLKKGGRLHSILLGSLCAYEHATNGHSFKARWFLRN